MKMKMVKNDENTWKTFTLTMSDSSREEAAKVAKELGISTGHLVRISLVSVVKKYRKDGELALKYSKDGDWSIDL